MDKFKNKYRTTSHRKPSWDYADDGLYFISLVTQNRICNLGEIADSKMNILLCPTIYTPLWLQRRTAVRLNVMGMTAVRLCVRFHNVLGITTRNPIKINHRSFVNQKSISSFVAGFKSAVNTKIDDYIDKHQLNIPKYNRNNHFFQPNYHDRIIRNENEYLRIKNYIINNPLNRNDDKFNKNNE